MGSYDKQTDFDTPLSDDVYYELDSNGIILSLSKSVERVLGYTPKELIGTSVYNLYVDPSTRDNQLREVKPKQTNIFIKAPFRHKMGQKVMVISKSTFIRDKKGDIIGIKGVARNVSSYDRFIKELNENQNIYHILFNCSPNGIVFYNPSGIIIDANDKALEILGVSKKQLIGFDIFKRVKNKDILKCVKECLELDKAHYKGLYTSVISGKLSYVQMIFKSIKDKNNYTIYAAIFIKDLTLEYNIEKKLLNSKKEWKSIIDNMINLFIQTDKNGVIKKASPSVKNILGYDKNEIIGKNILDFWINKQKAISLKEHYKNNPKKEKDVIAEVKDKKGEIVFLEVSISPRFDEQGNYVGSDNIAKDITDQIKAQKELKLYKKVIENTTEGIIITDSKNHIIYTNRAFSEITKYQKDEVLNKTPSILKSGLHDKKFYRQMWKSIDTKGFWRGEIWNKHKDNGIYPELLTINSIKNDKGKIENYIAIFTDISEIKKSQAKMRHLATHDNLTKLPNRVMLSEILKHSIKSAKRQKELMAIMFLDLDNFKMINDNFGHKEGDSILIETAKRLKKTLREDDVICRFGGDEFIIILEHIQDSKNLADIAYKLNQTLKIPYEMKNYTHYLSCSIGIAIYPNDAKTEDELIKNADAAMYQAKNSGKNRYFFYSHDLGKKIAKELHLENLLRDSINNNEFEIYYQPKITTETKKITSMEALLRWNNKELGYISPVEFIPIAEKTGLIIPIGNYVLLEACKQIKKWQDAGIYKGTISINASGIQLNNNNFINMLKNSLEKSLLDPKYLDLEVTESVLMSDANQWRDTLEEIRKLGIDISIDDFGTGYSSLSYLRELPIDELKIDKSFIDDIPHSKDACAITNSIISLAKSLGYKTVAEGVENKDQLTYLKDNGCDMIQGYIYTKPLPADKMELFLKQWCPQRDSNARPLD